MTEPTDRHRAAVEEISDVASPHYGTHDELAAILARHFPDPTPAPLVPRDEAVRNLVEAARCAAIYLEGRIDGKLWECARWIRTALARVEATEETDDAD